MCILIQHPRAQVIFDMAAQINPREPSTIMDFLRETAALYTTCPVCGEPPHVGGCPETPYSIKHAIDCANQERAEITRATGLPLAVVPYPEHVQ